MKKINKENKYIRDGRAPIPEKEITSKIMSRIKGKDTKPELILRKALCKAGLRGYRLHYKKVPGRPDIAFVEKKIAIFVNGCFWHRCPYCNPPFPKTHQDFWHAKFKKNIERDKRKYKELEKLSWIVIVVWGCEVKKQEFLNDLIEKMISWIGNEK